MKLVEKLATLDLGNLRLRRAFGQWAEGVERGKQCERRNRMVGRRPIPSDVKPRRFSSVRKSGQEMKRGSPAGICCRVGFGMNGEQFRLAQNKNGFAWEIVEQG